MIRIELAGEPRGKGRPRFHRASGRAYTPGQTRSYEADLKFEAMQAMGSRPLLEGAIRVVMHAKFSVPASWSNKKRVLALSGQLRPTKKPDIDNIAKMLDALNMAVWRDDAQVVSAEIRKVFAERPCLVVEVEALP